MAASDDVAFEPVTAWHPMLVALLETYLPEGWRLLNEFLLRRLPQRVDILILRKEGAEVGVVRRLHSIFDYLRPHTLIEHKGPTDDLRPEDALVLLGYAFQYMAMQHLSDPRDLCLMVVCDHIPGGFVEQLEHLGGALVPQGSGLWHGAICNLELHGVETGTAWRAGQSERLLYAFCRAHLRAPAAVLPISEEEQRVYHALYQHVEQFRRARGDLAMKDYEIMKMSWEELLKDYPLDMIENVMARLPPEKRLAGMPPEQRLAGLSTEERAKLLDALLASLPPEILEKAAERRKH